MRASDPVIQTPTHRRGEIFASAQRLKFDKIFLQNLLSRLNKRFHRFIPRFRSLRKATFLLFVVAALLVAAVSVSAPPARAATVTVIVETSPSNIPNSFSVDGVTYTTAQTFQWTVGSDHTLAAVSTVAGATGVQYVWTSWSDGGAISHMVTAPASSTTYVASFQTQYYLTVTGGSGAPDGQGWYNSGATGTATSEGAYSRSAGTGLRVSSYTVNGAKTIVATSGEVSVPLTMDQPFTVAFNIVTQFSLTLNTPATSALLAISSPPIAGDNYWYDAGTKVNYTGAGVYDRSSGVGSRTVNYWTDNGAPTDVLTTGNFTVSFTMSEPHDFYTSSKGQYEMTLNGGPGVDSVTSPTIPGDDYWYDNGTSVSLSLDGVYGRANGTGLRLATFELDGGTSTPVETLGSVVVLTSHAMSSPVTIGTTSVTQYFLTVTGGSGVILSPGPTISGDSNWYDSGTTVTATSDWVWNVVVGESRSALTGYEIDGTSHLLTRRDTGTFTSPSVKMDDPQSIAFLSVTQYLLKVNGGNGIFFGTQSQTLDSWYDAGTSTTVSSEGVWGRSDGSGERVASWNLDGGPNTTVATVGSVTTPSILMSTYHTVNFDSVTQFQLSLSSGASRAVSSVTSPPIPGDDYWYDAGTQVSLALSGVFGRSDGSGYRLASYQVGSGIPVELLSSGNVTVLNGTPISAPLTISAVVTSQFQVMLSPGAVSALYSITSPTISGDNYWYDSGSTVTVVLNGVWGRSSATGYRLSSYSFDGAPPTDVAESGQVMVANITSISAPQSVIAVVATQYLLTVSGGNGVSFSPKPPIPSQGTWFDSGTSVTVSTNSTYANTGDSRQRVVDWSLDGGANMSLGSNPEVSTSPINMSSPHSLVFYSVTQYLIRFQVVGAEGQSLPVPPSIQLSFSGQTVRVNGGSIWLDNGTSFELYEVAWEAANVKPGSSQTYTVTGATTIHISTQVYYASIYVTDFFGLPVAGASATLKLANSTVVHVVSSGSGEINLGQIPLGTYTGTISNLGQTSSVAGDAAVQSSLQTKVALSYAELILVTIATVLIVAVLFLVFGLKDKLFPPKKKIVQTPEAQPATPPPESQPPALSPPSSTEG